MQWSLIVSQEMQFLIEGTGLGAMKTLKSAIMNGGLKAKLGAFY